MHADLVARFDGAADDHARRREGETSFRLQARAVRAWLPDRCARVLDLGCGSGALAPLLGLVRPFGGDLSPSMLRHARARGLRVAATDAACLPYASGAFDAVLALGLLEYVPDVGRVLAEIVRVLRPGGVSVLTWPNPLAPVRLWMRLFPGRFDQDVARRLPAGRAASRARAAGLEVLRVRGTHPALLPWPLDALLPRFARAVACALEPITERPPLSILGTQTVLAARRPTA